MVNRKTVRCILSVLLICFMVVLSACTDGGNSSTGEPTKKPTTSSSPSEPSSSDNTTTDTPSGDSEKTEEPTFFDKLLGIFSFTQKSNQVRADADEIRTATKSANLYNPLKGYAEKEADKLRNQILSTGNTEKYYKIKGKKYYISASGNDDNDGTSPSKALRSIDGLDNIDLMPGDAVLFERGSIFRISRPISTESGVTYGSYGSGDKPIIYGSVKNYANKGVWQPSNKKNVWKTDFAYERISSVYFNHGEGIGYMQLAGVNELDKNTEFYFDKEGGMLYLYCDKGNPSNAYKDIEISSEVSVFNIPSRVSDIVIDNFCIKYANFGVNGMYRNNNVFVTNCEMGYLGGEMRNDVRQGNSVGAWNGSTGFVVENNWIYQTFDTAISPQGFDGFDYINMSFRNNLLEYNSVDFEWFDGDGTNYINFDCSNNIMRFTSLGWGTRMDDAGLRGIEGCIRANTLGEISFKNFTIKNNIIDCPGRQVINWQITPQQIKSLDISGNVLYVKKSYRDAMYTDNPPILLNWHLTGTVDNKLKVSNQKELNEAWKLFDSSPTAKAYWYD